MSVVENLLVAIVMNIFINGTQKWMRGKRGEIKWKPIHPNLHVMRAAMYTCVKISGEYEHLGSIDAF